VKLRIFFLGFPGGGWEPCIYTLETAVDEGVIYWTASRLVRTESHIIIIIIIIISTVGLPDSVYVCQMKWTTLTAPPPVRELELDLPEKAWGVLGGLAGFEWFGCA
jgi:hypothetical protein